MGELLHTTEVQILLILEVLKMLAWVVILIIALYHRKTISVDVLWLTIISSILMVLGSVEDIASGAIDHASGWWLLASAVVIINYYVILRRSWRFYGKTSKRLTDFVDQIEKDTKDLENKHKKETA